MMLVKKLLLVTFRDSSLLIQTSSILLVGLNLSCLLPKTEKRHVTQLKFCYFVSILGMKLFIGPPKTDYKELEVVE